MAGGVWRGEDAGPSSGRKTSPEQGPYNDLEVALSEGGALSGFGRREGMADYPWQQHAGSNTKNEVFADYFLNTVYGSFLGNDAGVAQYEWMLVQMRNWSQ